MCKVKRSCLVKNTSCLAVYGIPRFDLLVVFHETNAVIRKADQRKIHYKDDDMSMLYYCDPALL